MADFRVDTGFFRHVKTKKLKRMLGIDGVVFLMRLWAYAAENKHGADHVYSVDDIELAVDWDGKNGALVEALVDTGFIDADLNKGYVLHQWAEHNGFAATAKVREEKSRDAANAKWQKRVGGDASGKIRSERLAAAREKGRHSKREWEDMRSFFGCCVRCGAEGVDLVKDHIVPLYQGGSDGIENLQPMCAACNSAKGPDSTDYRLLWCESNACRMPAEWVRTPARTPAEWVLTPARTPAEWVLTPARTPAPSPSPSPSPSPTDNYSCPEPCAKATEPEPVEPIIMSIPLNAKNTEFNVCQSDVDQWQYTFPGVDVLTELRKCRQWSIDNPNRRKTKAGIRKHVSSWLGKEQDRSKGQPQAANTSKAIPIRSVRDAITVQRSEIARVLNEDYERSNGAGNASGSQEGCLLVEPEVSQHRIGQQPTGAAFKRIS